MYFCTQIVFIMTRLYLVRHGETVDNAAQILQGQTPGELNENGIHQAEIVRDQMKDAHIDVFISSDLHRSIQTAEIIAAPHHKVYQHIGKRIALVKFFLRDAGKIPGHEMQFFIDFRTDSRTVAVDFLQIIIQHNRTDLNDLKRYPRISPSAIRTLIPLKINYNVIHTCPIHVS